MISLDYAKVYLFIFISFTIQESNAQKSPTESTSKENKSEKIDSVILKSANNDIKSKVDYKAIDSIVFDMKTKKMYLYNKSNIDYEDIHIDAYYIDYDWNTGNMIGDEKKVTKDSILGRPYLKQGEKEYYTEKLIYNFKSQKGKVYDVVTEEGKGFLHGHEVKKSDTNIWFVSKAKYTTCNLEDPHFYLASNKIKLITKKAIIAGASNLMIHDVPVPIYLPFGVFPLQEGRRSGIILPKDYGFSPLFNIQDLGLYFAINDHMDLLLNTDIYFNGSYDVDALFNYSKRYKYTGSLSAGWNRIFVKGDSDNPEDRANTPANYNFRWIHAQSSKAHPTFTFNANVSFMTQGYYNRSLVVNQNTTNGNIQSNLLMTKRFRNSPFNITGSLGYNQNLSQKTVSGDLVSFTVNYNDNPFKIRKNLKSFLNFINLNYSTQAKGNFNSLPDSIFLSNQVFDQLRYGILNNFKFELGGIKILKNFNFSPSLTLTDRNYFKKLNVNSRLDSSYSQGFYNVMDFSLGAGLRTNVVGIFLFSQKGGFRGIKHMFTPSISFNYSPNFSNNLWNYYGSYNKGTQEVKYYPYYDLWGSYPPTHVNSILSFGISNSIEGKFRKGGDTSTTTIKRMLLDNLSLNGSYNFGVDSCNLSNFDFKISNSSLGYLNFDVTLVFDPYKYKLGEKTKEYLGAKGNLVRMSNMTATVNLNLTSQNFSKNSQNSKRGAGSEQNFINNTYYNFYNFNNPWNLGLSMTMNLRNEFSTTTKRDTTIITSSVNIPNFDFNLTKHWKLAIMSGYDFVQKYITITRISAIRDMHCWEFRINYSPISQFGAGYSIEIRPKATVLQDLRITRNKPAIDNYF